MRILAELDVNARAANTDIARTLGISDKTVKHRISSLEGEGVIKGFDALVDAPSFGYQGYRIYLKFQYANPKPGTQSRTMPLDPQCSHFIYSP